MELTIPRFDSRLGLHVLVGGGGGTAGAGRGGEASDVFDMRK